MASAGGGKMRPKRSHGASKPYQRTRPKSLLDRVKDLVTPSWLSSMWSSSSQDEPQPQAHSTRQPTSAANSIPPKQAIPDGQYFSQVGIDSAPGPSTKPMEAGRVVRTGEEEVNTPVLTSFGGLSIPVSTSTPIDVDEYVVEIDSGEGTSTQKDDVSEMSAPPSVVSSLYPNLDKLEHQQKLSESNLDLLSEIGHRRSPMPSSSLWSHTPSGRSATTRARPASPFNRPQQPAISTRRPAFNASYFGTPRGSLRTSSSLMESTSSSPFYPGRTTYGGASAQRSSAASKRSRTSPYEVHLPIKRSVRPRLAKPADESDMGITSSTAKRILDTLEKMSTPLSDAKRIPLSPSASPLAFTASRAPKVRLPPSPYRAPGLSTRGVRVPGPPVSGLSIPHTISIAPNRQPLLPTTTASTTTTTTTTTTNRLEQDIETDAATDRVGTLSEPTSAPESSLRPNAPAFASQPPPISRTDTTPVQSGTLQRSGSVGKMKQKRSSLHYSATKDDNDDDVVEIPDLPSVPLPLKTLPSFSFGKPLQPPKTTASTLSVPRASQGFTFATSTPAVSAPATKTDGNHEFTFASPILKQTASTISAPEFETTEAFTFSLPKKADVPPPPTSSKPLNFMKPSSSSSLLPSAAPAPSFKANNPVKSPAKDAEEEEEEEQGFGIKPAKTLKTGSCLEVFGIAPTESAPVTSAAPSTTAAPVTDVFAKFRPPPGAWKCDSCLLQNKADDTSCVACQNPKPKTAPSSDATTGSRDSSTISTSDLMAKFKPPEGSWKCSTCLVQNKKEADKCVACEAPSPVETQKAAPSPLNNSLMDKFRPPLGSWKCDTCLLQNKAEADKCIACTTPKPSVAGSNPTASSNTLTNSSGKGGFGSGKNAANSSASVKTDNFMDKFKPPAGSWKCDTCLIQNKESADRCIACETPKPGSQPSLKTPPASAFKFGGQSTTTSSSSAIGDIKFGGTKSDSLKFTQSNLNMPSGGFMFGAKKTSADTESGGFQFGASKGNSSIKFGSNTDSEAKTNSLPPAKTVQFGSDTASKADGGFKFGAPTVTSGKSDQDKPAISSGFQFGAALTKTDTAPPNVDLFKATEPSKTSFGTGGLVLNAVSTPTQETDSKEEQKQGFTFGASKDDAPKLNFGSSNTTQKQTAANFTFGAKASTDSGNPPVSGQTTTFQFTARSNPPATTVEPSTGITAVKFGATSSDTPDKTKVASVSSGFSFGGTAASAVNATQQLPHQNSVAPTFQFGKSTAGSDEAGTGQLPVKKGVTFGAVTEQIPTPENKPTFNFGGAPNQPTTQQASPFLFGSVDNKVETPSKPNGGIAFGAVTQSSTSAQSAEPFTFGAASNNSKPGIFNFSASTNQNAAPASGGFQFGSSAVTTATPTEQNTPAFGGFGGATTVSSTTFGSAFGNQPTNSTSNPFGSQQPSQAAAPAFGAPSGTSVFGSTATPAFGAVASAGNSRSSTPTFGAAGAGAAPGFGNTGPSFGAAASNAGIGFQPEPAPSFNFGGNNPTPSQAAGVFNFGAGNSQNAAAVAPQATSTGGFNFGQQPQPQGFGMQGAAQNAIGPASTGVFQFGANQTQASGASFTFGATPTTQQRKIRKAVRRTRKT